VPAVESLIQILHSVWISEGYPSREFEDEKRVEAERMLRDYYAKHSSNWTAPAYLEQRFRVVIGGETLTGSIDRLDILPSGDVEIIDYKTGSPKTADDLKFDTKRQLLIYLLAAERELHVKPTLLTYYYLQNNEAATFTPKDKDLEKIENFVAETVAEIRTNNFTPNPSQFACGNCDFKDVCPSRKL
jgi:DNA helicase-2/ATP-dependent DNA helicase PcrA